MEENKVLNEEIEAVKPSNFIYDFIARLCCKTI